MEGRSSFVGIAFCLAVAVSSASAQVTRSLTVHIPFDFVAANKTLPAGEYTVNTNPDYTVLIRSADNQHALFALAHGKRSFDVQKDAKLVFYRIGQGYSLSEIWPGGTEVGGQLPVTSRERLSAGNWSKTRVEVLATSRAVAKKK